MRNLPKARVARLAECHRQQKAGYNQHTSPKVKHRHYIQIGKNKCAILSFLKVKNYVRLIKLIMSIYY